MCRGCFACSFIHDCQRDVSVIKVVFFTKADNVVCVDGLVRLQAVFVLVYLVLKDTPVEPM